MKTFTESLDAYDLDYLTPACFAEATRRVNNGLPFSDAVKLLQDWAADSRSEQYCEGMEAIRFDADH